MAGNARFYVSPRDTDSTMPSSPSSIIRLVPPEEKNGRLMPVLGMVLAPVLSLLFGGFTLHAMRPLAVTFCRVSVTPKQGDFVSREISFFRCPALAAVEQTVLARVVLRLCGGVWYL